MESVFDEFRSIFGWRAEQFGRVRLVFGEHPFRLDDRVVPVSDNVIDHTDVRWQGLVMAFDRMPIDLNDFRLGQWTSFVTAAPRPRVTKPNRFIQHILKSIQEWDDGMVIHWPKRGYDVDRRIFDSSIGQTDLNGHWIGRFLGVFDHHVPISSIEYT